jgi:hypothetical protein
MNGRSASCLRGRVGPVVVIAGLVVGALALTSPVSGAQAPLLAADGAGAGDAFGFAVGTIGDQNGDAIADLLVGAPDSDLGGEDSGAVYVLSGADGAVLRLLPGPAPGDDFGYSVANAGHVDGDAVDDIVVGAAQASEVQEGWGGYGAGYAQVYSGADGALLFTWQGEIGINYDYSSFGRAVLGAGDIDQDGHDDIVVCDRDMELELDSRFDAVGGRVWIFSGSDGSVLRKIQNVGPLNNHLGWSVASAGDFDEDGTPDLVLGAPISNPPTTIRIVVVSGATSLPLVQISSAIGHMGHSVAVIGDVDDDGVPDVAGAARSRLAVYSGATGLPLFETADLHAPSGLHIGMPVAAVGDVDGDERGDVAVGAWDGPGTATGAGIVRVFSGATGEQVLSLPGSQPQAQFGGALAAAGDHDGDGLTDLLVGSPSFDGPAGVDAGRMSIHLSLTSKSHLAIYNPTGNFNQFGIVSACAGDVDNDGFADVVSGTASDGTAFLSAGRVDVFSGRDGAILYTFLGDQPNDRLGWSVASAGDVDADGYADVVSGAPLPTAATGPAYVRLWSGRSGALLYQFNGVSVGDQFGLAVTGMGDLDQDGHDDIAISAPYDDTAGSNFGAVRFYSGRTGSLLRLIPGTQSGAEFGYSVAAAGDIDADSVPDLIVGTRLHSTVNGTSSGSASVFSGATGVLLHVFLGPSSFDNAGWSVAGVGDVDGDGRPDVAVGAPFADGATAGSGIVRVYSGLDGSPLSTISSAAGPIGQAISGIADVDGDELADVVVGVPTADDGLNDAGAVRIHSGLSGELILSAPGPAVSDQLGYSVDGRGDVDNDGRADIVAGALGSALDPGNQGAIYAISIIGPPTPWQSEGKQLPGTHGAPVLAASGTLAAAAPVTLSLSNALHNSTATLVVGAIALNAPFKGGTLVPFPQFLVFGLPTGPAGSLVLAAPWPGGLPGGVTLHFQYWIVDAAAPAGLAASNAMKGTTP